MGMAIRIASEMSFVSDRTINFNRRNYILFRASVAQDRAALMKEVENSVMNVAVSHPQFIDVIVQVVGFWTPQFVSAFREPFDANHAFVLSLDLQTVQPRQQRR